MEYYATGEYNPDCPDLKAWPCGSRRGLGKKISLCLGIELGGAAHMPTGPKILSDLTPDLVIGSVHALPESRTFICTAEERSV